VPGAICNELLWRRSLLVDVITGAGAEGFVHFGRRYVDQFNFIDICTLAMASVLKHLHRLTTVQDKQFSAFKLFPTEVWVRLTRR
jgi:hypothetical protein